MHLGKFFTIKVLLITSLALLVLLIGAFVLAFVGFPAIIKWQIHKTVQLENGTIQWDRFKKQPIDFVLKLHLYNVNNADDVHKIGSLPDITEVGPYYFTQTLERIISEARDDDVTYTQKRKVTFDEKKSYPLEKTDKVIVPNPMIVVLTQLTSSIERIFAYGCIDMILPENMRNPFIEADIETLALSGLRFAKQDDITGPSCKIVRNLFIKRATPIKCVDVIHNEDGTVKELKFSILSFMQSKIDGIYTIDRGINDVNQLGTLLKWNGDNEFHYWGNPNAVNNETCNMVRGTDGTIYPPYITKDQSFEIYSSDVCRLVTIGYNGTKTYKGIDGYMFSIGPNTLKSAYSDPEKDCYCTKSTLDQTGSKSCFLDGVIDVQPCFRAPLILSWPHFLYADEYRNGVTGLQDPDPTIHQTFILIEPNTGTPLEGYKRVQLNFIIRPVEFMPMTKNHPRTLLPFTWLEEGVSLTQDLIDELDSKYYGKLKLVDGVKYALIAVFSAFFCISLVFLTRKKYCTKK